MVGRGLNGLDSGGRAFVVAVVVFLVGWRGRAAVQVSAQIWAAALVFHMHCGICWHRFVDIGDPTVLFVRSWQIITGTLNIHDGQKSEFESSFMCSTLRQININRRKDVAVQMILKTITMTCFE